VLPFFKIFLRREDLDVNENNVYRNFNVLLVIALLDLSVIAFSLKDIRPDWPFKVCVTEFLCYVILMILHTKGYLTFARYGTFLISLIVQVTACVTHGKTAGFDYLFYPIGLLPMLFFRQGGYYISLFIISIAAMLTVQYSYTITEPVILINADLMLYWNIFFTGALIFFIMYIFKTGYERTQKKLMDQHNLILQQKEEIEGINNNLEQIVVDRTEKIKEQESQITEFAFINAHKVRSPLARIMGILNLIPLEKNEKEILADYLPILKANADELNDRLQEVSDTLNDIGKMKKKP
jgi:signal transduction histidine kinase